MQQLLWYLNQTNRTCLFICRSYEHYETYSRKHKIVIFF